LPLRAIRNLCRYRVLIFRRHGGTRSHNDGNAITPNFESRQSRRSTSLPKEANCFSLAQINIAALKRAFRALRVFSLSSASRAFNPRTGRWREPRGPSNQSGPIITEPISQLATLNIGKKNQSWLDCDNGSACTKNPVALNTGGKALLLGR
jgi:hypothetical protein